MKIGDLAFSDLLTFERIAAVSAPYQALSLNSDLLWDFDYRNDSDYEVFNVRYVWRRVPADARIPRTRRATGRYALSRRGPAATSRSGVRDRLLRRQPQFLPAARSWLRSPLVAARQFPQVALAAPAGAPPDRTAAGGAARLLPSLAGRRRPPAGCSARRSRRTPTRPAWR